MLLIIYAVVAALFSAVSGRPYSVVYTSPRGRRIGYDRPADWELVNQALYAYCKPLNTCSDWRYQGYDLFNYYGDYESAPQNISLTVLSDPVKNLTAVRCRFRTETIYNRMAMNVILLKYCQPLDSCHDWRYQLCGQYAFNGTTMSNILPFSVAALRKELPTMPKFRVSNPPRLLEQQYGWLPVPHPILDPDTCKPAHEPNSTEVFPTDICRPSEPVKTDKVTTVALPHDD